MKNLAILGSTGSIGRQTLDIVRNNPDKFRVIALSARRNLKLLYEQAIEFSPEVAVIAEDVADVALYKAKFDELGINFLVGYDALEQIVELSQIDVVVTAVVGFSGLKPTIHAIKSGKDIALANKETLVVAGELVMTLAHQHNVKILPVDSEHSAIFQSLIGEDYQTIEKIYLTASGGPFRGMKIEDLRNITKDQALRHPNWSMGNKITIDSATLMNKGLEAIEAKWLFGLRPEQIDIIIHPQSIIHSLVQFVDGSIKAQMGLPDMRLPIQFALSYPYRIGNNFERFDFVNYPELTFEKPDLETFRALALALDALKTGGLAPCTLNAANEVAVSAFLEDRISFLQIADVVEKALEHVPTSGACSFEDYLECDQSIRYIASEIIAKS